MTRVTNPIRIATIREITATVVLIAEYSVLLLSVIAASLLSIVSDIMIVSLTYNAIIQMHSSLAKLLRTPD